MAQFQDGYVIITKDASAPSVPSGKAGIYVDSANNQPKVVYDDSSEFALIRSNIGSSNGSPVAIDSQGRMVLSTVAASGAAEGSYTETFTSADISGGILSVTHNLDSQYNGVFVFDNSDQEIQPDDITSTSTSVTTIDLSSYTITGTWRTLIISSGSQSNGIANIATEVIQLSTSQSVSTPAIYSIEPPSSGNDLTVTIPDANSNINDGQQMRFVLNRVNGGEVSVDIVTTSGQIIGDSTSQYIGQDSRGFAIISHNSKWIIIQDSRRSLSYTFQAPEFENPNNSDWAVNSLAPATSDSINEGLIVRAFDDTTEEGVGYNWLLPDWSTRVSITTLSRSVSGQAGDVVPNFYFRTLEPNQIGGDSLSTWSAAVSGSVITMTSDAKWQYYSENFILNDFGLGGTETQIFVEFTRDTDNPLDDLTGDWYLFSIDVELE
jgi:hypothetical protein